jgi:soluble lytic murein transglycosylase
LAQGDIPDVYLAAALASKYGSWKDQSNFFRAIARNAKDPDDFATAIGLSQKLGRPDLAVMAGRSARSAGIPELLGNSYPGQCSRRASPDMDTCPCNHAAGKPV